MKKVLKKSVEHTRKAIKGIPDKKQYVEFITAMLSIPMLLTVILLNYNNLHGKSSNTIPTPAPGIMRQVINTSPVAGTPGQSTPTPVTQQCVANIPPVSISSPSEGQTVTDNPVCFIISYDQKNYCSIVWSYRINGGSWSDYDNNSVCLYNVPQGQVQFNVKIKSLVGNSSTTLTRHITYAGGSGVAPTSTQNTGSASAH